MLVGMGAVVLATAGVALSDRFSDSVEEIRYPLRHDDIIRQQARDKNLDPVLIAAVIYQESRFRPRPSPAGAQGLMQILPSTGKYIASKTGGSKFVVEDLASPQVNIAYGAWYLRYLLDKYSEHTVLALAAYNAGEGKVDGWLAEANLRGEQFDNERHVPFPETREYVHGVLKARREYRRRYRRELTR